MKLFNVLASIVILSLPTLTVTAQTSPLKQSDSVVLVIKKYINEKNSGAIHEMLSDTFKKQFDKEKLNTFFEKEIYPFGPVKQSTFIAVEQNVSKYKFQFDTRKLEFSFLLNEKSKFNPFAFLPFKSVATIKSAPVGSTNKLSSLMDRQVDSLARTYIQNSNTVGLSIAILKDRQTTTYGYGETKKGNNTIPEANTIFEIGSITKTFTGTILAHYVNEGKIKLDDPITKYLPDSVSVNPDLHKITIVHLVNHTSGLPRIPSNFENKMNPANPYVHYDTKLLFSGLKTSKLTTEPGSEVAYSNLGFGLLGTILERVSGKTYDELVQQLISIPQKMSSTAQSLTPAQAKRFVKVYDAEGDETPPWDFSALAGCGALHSTAADLVSYAKSNIRTEMNAMLSAVVPKYNAMKLLGWQYLQINGDNYYWHNGGTGGSRSYLIFNSLKGTAVVVLSNSNVSVDEIGLSIMKKISE